jgi:LacI family transcriptional regulator
MKDVAAVAGVSLATVSRVTSGSGEVRPELAARVHDAVELLGFRRDLTASTLRRADRLSASVGLVFEDVSNPFFAAVHRGVEDVARERGVLAFAGSSDDDDGRERELCEAFASRRVDGLIVAPCGDDQSYLQRDRAAGVVLVFVDRPPRFIDADSVVSDNATGTREAIAHLVASGHRRIGFLADRHYIFTAAERLRGYREELTGHGITPDPALERLDLTDSAVAADAVRDLLAAPEPPTALFTGQNLITVGALHVLRELGLERKVALVGFDDVVLGDLIEPGVTVVAQDPIEVGRRAAELLFSRLDGFDGPSRQVVIPTTLIQRGSGELAPA